MKLGYRIPSGTINIDKKYTEDEIFEFNKYKFIPEDIKKEIIKSMFDKKRNFHLIIKDYGETKRVNWQERLNDELRKIKNPIWNTFIYAFKRNAKARFMIYEELLKLKGNSEQIALSMEKSINAGICSVNYVRSVLKSIREKDEIELTQVESDNRVNELALKTLRDYEEKE